jgi:hypothetical protein
MAVTIADWKHDGAQEQGAPEPPISRAVAAVELAGLFVLIELIMWVVPVISDPAPKTSYAVVAIVIALLLAGCFVRDRLSAWQLGFRFDNFFRVLWDLTPPLLLFVALVVGIGAISGSLRFKGRFFSMLVVVPFWACFQQYMLLAFANRRFAVLFSNKDATVLATAALFGILHMPNPVLMVATTVGGYLWAREYERRPNIFANSITHGIASAFLANTLPHWLLKNMVVGYNHFFR